MYMCIFNKNNGTNLQSNIPLYNLKSSFIWVKLQQSTPFSKGMGQKIAMSLIVRQI